MAGRGTRFSSISPYPKPLVPLHGQPLVRWVVENLRFQRDQRYIFVCLREHIENYKLNEIFKSWDIKFEIIESPSVTEGAACSALLAKELYRNNELIIANSDQYLFFDKESFIDKARTNHGGLIMSMNADGPKWSYIRTNAFGKVTQVVEKSQISNLGTTGVYYFSQGQLFESSAAKMIEANDRFNNEFYLAPSYNYLIDAGVSVDHFNIGDIGKEMIGLGTAEDFKKFENSPLSLKTKGKLFT